MVSGLGEQVENETGVVVTFDLQKFYIMYVMRLEKKCLGGVDIGVCGYYMLCAKYNGQEVEMCDLKIEAMGILTHRLAQEFERENNTHMEAYDSYLDADVPLYAGDMVVVTEDDSEYVLRSDVWHHFVPSALERWEKEAVGAGV